jgi:hypothetical protein
MHKSSGMRIRNSFHDPNQIVLQFYDSPDNVRKPSRTKFYDKKIGDETAAPDKKIKPILTAIRRLLRNKANSMLKDFELVLSQQTYGEAYLIVKPDGKVSIESIMANAERLQVLSGKGVGNARAREERIEYYRMEEPPRPRFNSQVSRAKKGRRLATELVYLSKMHDFVVEGKLKELVEYFDKDLYLMEMRGIEGKSAAKKLRENASLSKAIEKAKAELEKKN